MPQLTTVLGNDVVNGPQGQVLTNILIELRIHTTLLQMILQGAIDAGGAATLRGDALIEPVINVTPVLS